MQRLGRVVSKITDPTFRKRGFIHTEIISRWKTIVGEDLSAACIPQRISFPARQSGPGVLHVRVEGARATELQHVAPLVIERINTYFGYRAIDAMRLTQDEIPKAPASAAVPPTPTDQAEKAETHGQLARTHDPELRDALAALGRRIQDAQPTTSSGD